MSCFIQKPSKAFLFGCSVFGTTLGLVLIPYSLFQTIPVIAKFGNKCVQQLPKSEKVSSSLSNGGSQIANLIDSGFDIFENTNYQTRFGILSILYGSVVTFPSFYLNFDLFKQQLKRYKNDPLIQTVCCNRIRFFASGSFVQGVFFASAVTGLFFFVDGCFRVHQQKQGQTWKRGLIDTPLFDTIPLNRFQTTLRKLNPNQ